ncbi:serine/threonine-protein phosphatase 7 long form-like protein, partial [Trifolium medium]|nr:serine/threonine-protein phosphatase 7 long form-like protein [Trifolium medium]
PAEFPGGPKDTSVLTSYKAHFARYVYEGYHRLTLWPVNHGRKMKQLDLEVPDEQRFRERLWHEDTSSFHMPSEEITVTLDDVSCLLHLDCSLASGPVYRRVIIHTLGV